MRIVKAVFDVNIAGSREGPYEMLEPDAGKLASPVLRGRGGGNIALLPGHLYDCAAQGDKRAVLEAAQIETCKTAPKGVEGSQWTDSPDVPTNVKG